MHLIPLINSDASQQYWYVFYFIVCILFYTKNDNDSNLIHIRAHNTFRKIPLKSLPSGHLVRKWRRINVDATWLRRIDVDTTSFWHQMPAG